MPKIKKIEFTFRGDTREEKKVRDAGGFVPKYLVRNHEGKFDGFKECKNKQPEKMGCGCDHHSETALYERAREKLQEVLLKPSLIQEHIRDNNQGFLSAGRKPDENGLSSAEAKREKGDESNSDAKRNKGDEAFNREFIYEIHNAWAIDAPLKEAADKMQLNVGNIPSLWKDVRLVSNSKSLSEATVFGFVPNSGVEVTYISPIANEHIKLNRQQPEFREPEPSDTKSTNAPVANSADGTGGNFAPPPPPPPPPPPKGG